MIRQDNRIILRVFARFLDHDFPMPQFTVVTIDLVPPPRFGVIKNRIARFFTRCKNGE